jgi:hypothetical protein
MENLKLEKSQDMEINQKVSRKSIEEAPKTI